MPLDLSQEDVEFIKQRLDRGEPLPDRYRASLFGDARQAELIWPGKNTRVETSVLPFQSIEHIDEPRVELGEIPLFSMDQGTGRQTGGWTNKLIWGDNRLILSSLANGPLRRQIEEAGGLKLIYIDPPFDVGADFTMDIDVGDEEVRKEPSVIEELAYRDTWGRGADSFISMLHERLLLMHGLLATDGSIFVHCDWRVHPYVRLVLSEVFGSDNLRNELVWHYAGTGQSTSGFVKKHDNIVFFAKSKNSPYYPVRVAGRKVSGWTGKSDKAADSCWSDILTVFQHERHNVLGYPTQKPEALLSRILEATTKPGDLVADFFAGSGTTAAVAEKSERKWIAADLGRFAIHTTRKRLIGVQRELAAEGKPYRAFEVLNLGHYERQHFVGIDPNLPRDELVRQSKAREEAYLNLILRAYNAERATSALPFHGFSGRAAILVGPIDAPITENQVLEAIEAAVAIGITRVDMLGFEFEMGLKPLLQDKAKTRGVSLSLRHIPNDVFDKRAIENGDVTFYDVAYVEFNSEPKSPLEVAISLTDFAVFYNQEDADAAEAGLKRGSTRVVVDHGQVVKVNKDKKGTATREVLTPNWSDWIDYWAVDFDYESQPEILRVLEDGEERQVRTGRFIFENQWQSFRTKKDRSIKLTTAAHTYDRPGTYKVAVKVIDIFGNDTTRVSPIKVGG